MKFFPPILITYQTRLPKEEALARIVKEITPMYLHGSPERYKGNVTGDSFTLKKMILSPYSRLPQISGVIETDGEHSIIKLKIKLLPFIKLFASVWLLMFTYTLVVGFIALVSGKIPVTVFLGFIVFVPLFILLMYKRMDGKFLREVAGVNDDLKELLEAEEV